MTALYWSSVSLVNTTETTPSAFAQGTCRAGSQQTIGDAIKERTRSDSPPKCQFVKTSGGNWQKPLKRSVAPFAADL